LVRSYPVKDIKTAYRQLLATNNVKYRNGDMKEIQALDYSSVAVETLNRVPKEKKLPIKP